MNHLVIFSTIYLIVASVAPAMGYYALRQNLKATTNRIFMLICLCIMFWALGFSVAIVAPDMQTAASWTRVAAIGYELIYSVLLHFILHLTGYKNLLKHKLFLALMYLPAVICLYAFVISPEITSVVYQFESTARGWIRISGGVIYDYIFRVYYVGMVSLCLLLLYIWWRKSKDANSKKQAGILLVSIVIAFGFGSFTDMLNGRVFDLPIPLMAPAFFIIPLSAIFYGINNYHFMRPYTIDRMELILSNKLRGIIFEVFAYLFIAGGIVLSGLELIWLETQNISLSVFSSLLLITLGLIMLYIQKTKKGLKSIDFILTMGVLILTPILTVNMVELGGMSIWVIPVVFVISSLIFNWDDMLFAAAVSMILAQLYLFGIQPQITVLIDYRTYVIRGILLFLIITAAYFVHRIYVERLKDNAEQTRRHTLISDITSGFSLSSEEDTQQRIQYLLMKLSGYFGVESVFMHTTDQEYYALFKEQYYNVSGGTQLLLEERKQILERFNACMGDYVKSNSSSPHEFYSSKEQLEKRKALPWLFIPFYEGEKTVGFIFMETLRNASNWTQHQLAALPVLSRIVSNTLENHKSEAHIKFMAYYDSLTKLPNRHLFHDRATQAIHLARRNNKLIGVMFLDLDFFKSINDTMGHEGGDYLIKELGKKLSGEVRKSDTVARFGGDEFLVLFNHVSDVEDIACAAEKVMHIFKEPVLIRGQEIFITASAGLSVFPVDGEDVTSLIKHADMAMYTAKENGKNQFAFCSDNMKESVRYRMRLTNGLYRALERGELELYYQPQVDLQNEKIVGVEALLRWHHPDYGMVPPLEFIPIAEQTGLITSIGQWVLETACKQVMEWHAAGYGKLRVAVNLSVVQLRFPGLPAQIAKTLFKIGIDPSMVELEITESATAKEADYIIQVISNLKKLGVSISIDDFGTEYSSLNRLKQLPVDKLKMDMQFVHGIERSCKDRAISLVIMNLAKNLDLKLVAEGVENNTQLEFLKMRMCDEVQGFYYYKPMPAHELEKVLSQNINH